MREPGRDIATAHQAFAYQNGTGPAPFEPFDIRARKNAAFGDEQMLWRLKFRVRTLKGGF